MAYLNIDNSIYLGFPFNKDATYNLSVGFRYIRSLLWFFHKLTITQLFPFYVARQNYNSLT